MVPFLFNLVPAAIDNAHEGCFWTKVTVSPSIFAYDMVCLGTMRAVHVL